MPRFIVLVASLALLTACPLVEQRKPEVSKLKRTKVPYTLPKLTALGTTEATQTKGSVTVAVSTSPFEVKKRTCKKYKQLPATWVTNEQYPYEVTSIPYAEVQPSKLVFRVRVVNGLNQVMRLAGSLVRFQIDGKEVTLKDPTAIDRFTSNVLAPGESKELELEGPRINAIPEKANVALMLFGIVTETDAAGNPSKRESFEYYFRLESETREIMAETMVEEMTFTPQSVPHNTCRF